MQGLRIFARLLDLAAVCGGGDEVMHKLRLQIVFREEFEGFLIRIFARIMIG